MTGQEIIDTITQLAPTWGPLLLSVLPSIGILISIVVQVKKMFTSNKEMIHKIVNQVKDANAGDVKVIYEQFNLFINQFKEEFNSLRNDNQIMAKIISEVVLAKSVPSDAQRNVLRLSDQLSSSEVKKTITNKLHQQEMAKTEIKVAEIVIPKPVEPIKTTPAYVPISE